MAIKSSKRRQALASQGRPKSQVDTFYEDRCLAINNNQLIPVIGDTIRNAHIFDVNDDQDVGDDGFAEKKNKREDTEIPKTAEDNEIPHEELNVTEELAQYWAEEVDYPLADRHQIARVAQFHTLKKGYDVMAKVNYLSFMKSFLLEIAEDMAQEDANLEELEFIKQLKEDSTLSFSDIVTELDFPQFSNDKKDPLKTLAKFPLKIYITTSYYDFLERELEAVGKHPKSRLCYWNGRPTDLAKEHTADPNYTPDVNNPVVFHLFGMEQYPQSLVLSVDDYLDFLWNLARDLPGDSGERIIPPYLQAELNNSSLLLLGYRLGDWDLRILFRGLLNSEKSLVQRQMPSTAVQINLKNQPLVENKEEASRYLKMYFKQADLDVRFGESDQFISDLWDEWQHRRQGTNKQ